MLYYAMLAGSSLLFALQFLFQQKFQKSAGATFDTSLSFSFYTSLISLPFLFAMNAGRIAFTVPTLLCALISALITLLCHFVSCRSLQTVNLALYSVYASLGGMALPFIYGICFLGEPLTAAKLICFLVIAAAMFLTVSDLPKANRKAVIWYAAVFALNGILGIASSFHQNMQGAADSTSFLFYISIFCALFSAIWQLARAKRLTAIGKQAFSACTLYTVVHALAGLLSLIALKHLPTSVLCPISTGGIMFFSSMVGLCRGEKLTLREVLSLALAVSASIIIAL